jgi:hypothetical protein
MVLSSVKNSFRFFRKIFFAEDFLGGLPQKFEEFFSLFFAILVPKKFFHEKNIIYKNFSVFSAKPKNFFASGKIFFFIFLSLVLREAL